MAADNLASPEVALAAVYRRLQARIAELLRLATAQQRVGRALSPAFLSGQLQQISQALASVDAATNEWIGTQIPSQYRLSAGAADATLREAGMGFNVGFTGLDRRAVRALQERVADNLSHVREALTEGLALGDPREATGRLAQVIAGDSSLVTFVGDVLRVATPSGRLWDVEGYSRMLGRTAIADSRRVAFRQRYLANGIDVVTVVANGSDHPACQVWEGRNLSLTGVTPGLPTVADARAAGLFHPNCRHRYVVATDVEQPGLLEEAGEVAAAEPALPILGRAPGATELPAPRVPRSTL